MATKEEIQTLLTTYTASQEARRAIERELAGIDGEIKSAISLGRADEVIRFTARKNELPRLLIEASGVEAAHGVAYYAAQRDESYRIADELQTEYERVEEAFFKRKAEVERELAELQAGVNRAQRKAGEAAVTHQSYVIQLDRASAGYYRELDKAAKTL